MRGKQTQTSPTTLFQITPAQLLDIRNSVYFCTSPSITPSCFVCLAACFRTHLWETYFTQSNREVGWGKKKTKTKTKTSSGCLTRKERHVTTTILFLATTRMFIPIPSFFLLAHQKKYSQVVQQETVKDLNTIYKVCVENMCGEAGSGEWYVSNVLKDTEFHHMEKWGKTWEEKVKKHRGFENVWERAKGSYGLFHFYFCICFTICILH